MDFAFTDDQLAIKESVTRLCAQFDGKYWLKKDKDGGFPETSTRRWPMPAGWASPCPRNTADRAWASPRRRF